MRVSQISTGLWRWPWGPWAIWMLWKAGGSYSHREAARRSLPSLGAGIVAAPLWQGLTRIGLHAQAPTAAPSPSPTALHLTPRPLTPASSLLLKHKRHSAQDLCACWSLCLEQIPEWLLHPPMSFRSLPQTILSQTGLSASTARVALLSSQHMTLFFWFLVFFF